MSTKQLYNLVKKGKRGENVGIPTGIPKLDAVMYGIQKGYLYTIGASSGIGKSSFSISTFVYNLIENSKDTPISILFYSFEMSKEVLLAKLLSRHIYDNYGEIVTYEDILSLTQPISDEHLALVNDSKEWLDSIEERMVVYDKPLSPNAIYATCKEWLKSFGEFVAIDEHKEDYIERDSSTYKVVVWDHVGLCAGPGSKKEKIDILADYAIYFRNKCHISGIFVQQLNRGVSSMDRKTNGFELVGLEDFKDSSGTTDASEVVIALYSPYREKIARCEGYPIQNVLKDRFILLEVIKNRFGRSGVNIGTIFHGEINRFIQLPRPEEIGDYTKYLDLTYIEKDDKKETDEDNKNIFKF